MKIRYLLFCWFIGVTNVSAESLDINVSETTAPIAYTLAKQLGQIGTKWREHFTTENHQMSLDTLNQMLQQRSGKGHWDTHNWETAEQKLIDLKGYNEFTDSLLEIRLANPEALSNSSSPLVTFIPKGDEKSWQSIQAFDTQGQIHHLDLFETPEQPVLVVDVDTKVDLYAGIKKLNQALAKKGLAPEPLKSGSKHHRRLAEDTSTSSSNKGYKFTKLERIYVLDDKEPWIKGKAEFYALVSGIHVQKDKPLISAVDMPYLTQHEQEYRPNQMVVAWGQHRFNAANIMLYEQDGNFNYKKIINHLVEATATLADMAGYQDISSIINIGNAILQAMPNDWYEDSDDFVDAFYMIERNKTYSNYPGAANNVTASFLPFLAEK